jgi:hypothetical protein
MAKLFIQYRFSPPHRIILYNFNDRHHAYFTFFNDISEIYYAYRLTGLSEKESYHQFTSYGPKISKLIGRSISPLLTDARPYLKKKMMIINKKR